MQYKSVAREGVRGSGMVSRNIHHAAGTVYKYSLLFSIMWNGLGWAGIAVGLVLAVFGAVEAIQGVSGAVAGVPAGLFFSGMFALLSKCMFARTRPITISDAGIMALMLGRPWQKLAWSQVKRIELIRAYIGTTNSIGYRVHVVGNGVDIWIDYTINAFDALLVDLSVCAQQHQIELWTRDRSPDTYRKIKAEVTDVQERRRLIKSGVVTKVTSLGAQ